MVDEYGYVPAKTVHEGALGCVIRAFWSESPSRTARGAKDNYVALKIPRLVSDTDRENAYICDLLDKEYSVAHTVALGQTECLINPKEGEPLRGVKHLDSPVPDHLEQNGGIILVGFEEGKTPRFCNLKHNGSELKVRPIHALSPTDLQQITDKFGPPITFAGISVPEVAQVWSDLEHEATSADGPFRTSVILRSKERSDSAQQEAKGATTDQVGPPLLAPAKGVQPGMLAFPLFCSTGPPAASTKH
jgi:hypothetical protein